MATAMADGGGNKKDGHDDNDNDSMYPGNVIILAPESYVASKRFLHSLTTL